MLSCVRNALKWDQILKIPKSQNFSLFQRIQRSLYIIEQKNAKKIQKMRWNGAGISTLVMNLFLNNTM